MSAISRRNAVMSCEREAMFDGGWMLFAVMPVHGAYKARSVKIGDSDTPHEVANKLRYLAREIDETAESQREQRTRRKNAITSEWQKWMSYRTWKTYFRMWC